jgi:hypothetical protein
MQILEENFKEYSHETLREYVETAAKNDHSFFRFLFNEDFDSDFDSDLTKEHRSIYNEFIKSL